MRHRMRLSHIKKDRFAGYMMISPYVLLFIAFTVFPILHGFTISFTSWTIIGQETPFVALDNYVKLVFDEVFWKSLKNSLYFTVLSTPLEIAIGFGIAVALDAPLKSKETFRIALFLPYVLSVSVVATIWLWIYQPYFGLLSYYGTSLGFQVSNPLKNPVAAMPAIAVTSIWWATSFSVVTFLAGLQEIPQQLYEAAQIDGANNWECLRYVTLPCIKRITFFLCIVKISLAFKVFDLVYIMTQGGPFGSTRGVVQYIYENAFRYFRMGYASAASYLFFAVILFLGIMEFRFFKAEMATQ